MSLPEGMTGSFSLTAFVLPGLAALSEVFGRCLPGSFGVKHEEVSDLRYKNIEDPA